MHMSLLYIELVSPPLNLLLRHLDGIPSNITNNVLPLTTVYFNPSLLNFCWACHNCIRNCIFLALKLVQVKELAEKARTGKLAPHQFQGGTFRWLDAISEFHFYYAQLIYYWRPWYHAASQILGCILWTTFVLSSTLLRFLFYCLFTFISFSSYFTGLLWIISKFHHAGRHTCCRER